MKKFSVLFSASLLALSAQAQSPGPAATTPPAASAPPVVNPFTQVRLSVEELQAELETSRLRTSALEEQLKQTNLTSEITSVPLRKGVEAAQARVSAKAEELKLTELERTARSQAQAESRAREAEREEAREAKRAKRARTTPASAQAQAQESVPPAPVVPTLLSVVSMGSTRSAILDFSGNTLVVENGGTSPAGAVQILDAESVSVGGRKLKVSSVTLSRFSRSDQTQQADASGAPIATAQPPRPAAQPATQLSPTVGVPSTSGAPADGLQARLPPLQLPPGMTVLPASAR